MAGIGINFVMVERDGIVEGIHGPFSSKGEAKALAASKGGRLIGAESHFKFILEEYSKFAFAGYCSFLRQRGENPVDFPEFKRKMVSILRDDARENYSTFRSFKKYNPQYFYET